MDNNTPPSESKDEHQFGTSYDSTPNHDGPHKLHDNNAPIIPSESDDEHQLGTHKLHDNNDPIIPSESGDEHQLGIHKIHDNNDPVTPSVLKDEHRLGTSNDSTPIYNETLKMHNVNHDEIHPFFPKESKYEEDRFEASNRSTPISSNPSSPSRNATSDNKPTHIDIPPEIDNTKTHNYMLRGAPMATDTKDQDDTDRPLHHIDHTANHNRHHDKVTKKEKVGTALQKTMGTVKERIGKMVKNENLTEKGHQQKEHAEIKQKLRAIDQ
jgi:uncharacterized protein YjbJ (UPF0337 family)